MKVCVLLIFMVIPLISSDKATSKLQRKLIIPKINDKCKKIKCASVEEPECVKLTRHDLGHTFHIIVVNKCELEYIKCHDDVEAKLVPMKFCGHSAGVTASNKKNKTGKTHIRVKRKVTSKTAKNKTGLLVKQPKLHLSKNLLWKKEASNMIPKDDIAKVNNRSEQKIKNVEKHIRQRYPYTTDTESDIEKNERLKIAKGIAGHLVDVQDLQSTSLKVHAHSDSEEPIQSGISSKFEQKSVNIAEHNDFPMISIEAANNTKAGLAEADKEEYESACPYFCPSRDVMVCARCQHGIYKTFVSVCHMRMFICLHDDEELELVSRYPCVLSAPYISELRMQPRGRIVEAGDDDKILRFIMCRDKGQLGSAVQTADPKCNFEETKPTLRGIGIRFPTSSEQSSSSNTLGSSSTWDSSSSSNSSALSSSSSLTSTGLSSSGTVSRSSESSC